MNDERNRRVFDIDARAVAYAARTVKLVRFLQAKRDIASEIIARQLLRSAMSIGANLSEARSAETKRDFVHKCTISLKEARECLYWLRLLVAAEMVTEKRLADFLKETDELIAILTTIIKRSKRALS